MADSVGCEIARVYGLSHAGLTYTPDSWKENPNLTDDLKKVAESWADLPPVIRQTIVTMIEATTKGGSADA